MKKRKIKININNALCVVHLSTAISWRGGEQQLVYLYEELEKSNIEQFIVCSKHSAIESYCIKHQLSFISIKKLTGFDIFFAKKLNNFCKSINAGIIHTHDSHAHTIALLSHVIFKNNAPVIVSRRVDFPLHSKLSSWKYNHPIVKQILCVSGKIKEVMNPFIKDKSKLEVVYSGIDLERFCSRKKENILKSQYHLSENTILIGNASALADHKDYFTFIDVAEKMEKKK